LHGDSPYRRTFASMGVKASNPETGGDLRQTVVVRRVASNSPRSSQKCVRGNALTPLSHDLRTDPGHLKIIKS